MKLPFLIRTEQGTEAQPGAGCGEGARLESERSRVWLTPHRTLQRAKELAPTKGNVTFGAGHLFFN